MLTAPLVLAFLTGCFATRGDMRILQGDINAARTESQRSAQAQTQALAETARILQAVSDSLTQVSSRQLAFEGDTRGALRRVNEQLVQVQELMGQSASIIRSLRADIETSGRAQQALPPLPPNEGAIARPGTGSAAPPANRGVPPTTAAVTPNPSLPGASQLYQDGLDHFRRSSYASARIAFSDLLINYPGADVASDAQYWIGEAFAAERNLEAAQTSYAAVVSKYPGSARAPDALFKRGVLLLEQGNAAAAKPLLQQVVERYPRSDAAVYAKERLAAIP